MKITTIGRGTIGSGLGRLWTDAGHSVTTLGREGGDASTADVVLVAVPSGAITEALSKVSGLDGKIAIDVSNEFAGRNPDFPSFAHEVKATTGGPVAKAFNTSPGILFDRIADQSAAPSLLYASDPEAKAVTEQLIRDAGFEPASVGGLEMARTLEDFLVGLLLKLQPVGEVFYRFSATL